MKAAYSWFQIYGASREKAPDFDTRKCRGGGPTGFHFVCLFISTCSQTYIPEISDSQTSPLWPHPSGCREFLKGLRREYAALVRVVQQYAVAHPQCRFLCVNLAKGAKVGGGLGGVGAVGGGYTYYVC